MLRLLRSDRAGLRARALALGRAALPDTPRQFVRRVVSHWRPEGGRGRTGARTSRAPHAA